MCRRGRSSARARSGHKIQGYSLWLLGWCGGEGCSSRFDLSFWIKGFIASNQMMGANPMMRIRYVIGPMSSFIGVSLELKCVLAEPVGNDFTVAFFKFDTDGFSAEVSGCYKCRA